MKGGRFKKLKKPSGFTGKKPGDRAGSEAEKKPAKKGGILAIGISAGKPPVDELDENPVAPVENPVMDPLMDEMPMGMGGMEEGGAMEPGIKRFFADAAIEKLMRLQR
jgi:hypothetical protein